MTKNLPILLALAALASGCSASSSEDVNQESYGLSNPTISLSGEYRFAGRVEPLNRLTVDVVDMRMSDAKDRLEAVKSGGGQCTLAVSNTYRCVTHGDAVDVSTESLDKAKERNANLAVTFGPVTGGAELVSQAPGLTEYKIHQQGSSPLGAFEEYTYLDLGDLVKIVLPSGGIETLELMVDKDGTLRKWERVVDHEGRWRWHEDATLVYLAQ